MTFLEISQLLTQTPGETLYYVLVFGLGVAVWMMALNQPPTVRQGADAGRMMTGAIGVIGVWLLWGFGLVVAQWLNMDVVGLLPVLEAISSLWFLVILGWLFNESLRPRLVQPLALALLLLTGLACVWAYQSTLSDVDFRVLWFGCGVALSLIFSVLIFAQMQTRDDAPLQALLFGILGAAYMVGLVAVSRGRDDVDSVGVLRLANLASMVVWAVLMYRFVVKRLSSMTNDARAIALITQQEDNVARFRRKKNDNTPQPPTETGTTSPPYVSPIERESVQLIRALGLMLEESSPATIPHQIIQAMMDVLKVDIAVLLRVKDANYADVELGYDRFLERDIEGMAINLAHQPTLVNALERRTQRAMFLERNDDELRELYDRLEVDPIGPAYFQPMFRGEQLVAIVFLGMPYSKRELNKSEEELLKGISVMAGSLLELSYLAIDAQMLAEERAIQAMVNRVSPKQIGDADIIHARQALQDSLQFSREQITDLNRQVIDLKIRLEAERGRVLQDLGDDEEALSASQQMTSLYAKHRELQDERDMLSARLQELQAVLKGAVSKDDLIVYKEMLETLQLERDSLAQQRDDLAFELERLKNQSGGLIHPDDLVKAVDRMETESIRLAQEQAIIRDKLGEVMQKLRDSGVNVEQAGLAEYILRLSEQRDALLVETESLRHALAERGDMGMEDDRVEMLQATLKNVASDRETALKQRDKLRRELGDLREKLHVLRLRWQELEIQAKQAQAKARAVQEEKTILQSEILRLNNEKSRLVNTRDRLEAERQALEMERDQLLSRLEGDRARVEMLGENGVGSLTTMIADLTEQRERLEIELHETRQQLQDASDALAVVQQQREEPIQSDKYQPANEELLIGLVQEFRTPMTSITGYVDLLISESAGILGEMQRKFLQRVYSNVQRLDSMLDDLVKITQIDTGTFRLAPVTVNVPNLIEDVITHGANQFREKDLTFNLLIEDDLPDVSADRDALGQVIGQLLTNAYLVSPPSSEITVQVEHRAGAALNGHAADCLFVSVVDRGGGIPPEDEPRVFSRKYKADNPLVQGLGDTGVGLSIAKALIEAQGGRLWLETEQNVGSRLNFLLPIQAVHEG